MMTVFLIGAGGAYALAFGGRSLVIFLAVLAVLESMPAKWGYDAGVATREAIQGVMQ